MKQTNFLLPLFAAVAAFLTLFTLTGYQMTSETAGLRLEGRLAAALVEIDRWLPGHEDDIRLLARDRADGVTEIADLPLHVTLPSELVADADRTTLRRLIVESMAQSLYDDANGALDRDNGSPPSIASAPYWAIQLSSSNAHGLWELALPLSLLATVGLSAALLLSNRVVTPPLISGSVAGLVLSVVAWVLASALSGGAGSPLDREILLIVRDGAFIGIRNCAAIAVTLLVVHFLVSLGTANHASSWHGPLPTDPAEPDPSA